MGKCDEESAACKQDSKDYDDAAFDRSTAEQTTNQAIDDLNRAEKGIAAGGLTAGAGLTVGATTGFTGIGLFVGVGIAVVGAGIAVGSALAFREARLRRNQARADCQAARQRMKAAYDKSLTDCRDSDCRPPAAIPACP